MKLPAGHVVIEAIALAYRAHRPLLLIGPHGIGKSSLLEAAAKKLHIRFVVRDLSLMEPVDLTGIPQVIDGTTHFARPSFLPVDGKGILAFEELNRAPRYMRASCLELLTARRLNDYCLPSGWTSMASINPTDGYIDTEELDVALLSRFLRVEVAACVDEWCRWSRNNGVHEHVAQFVEQSSGALDSKGTNPRSWTYASDVLKAWETEKERNEEALAALLCGTLGDHWALAFLQFYQHGRKPLTANQIVAEYTIQRAAVKCWIADTKLDLVAASLEALKRYMQPRRHFDALMSNAQHKTNVETFLGDLPPDLKKQVRDWFNERGFKDIIVPRKPRK